MNLKEVTKSLIDAYGVTGNEYAVAKIACDLLTPLVDRAEVDPLGNVVGYRFSGKTGAKKLLFDAHIDQIGFMVTGFTPDGFVRFHALAPEDSLPGSELTVLTREGPLTGVVGWVPAPAGAKGGQGEIPRVQDLFIDLGLTEEEAREKIEIGDFISYGCDAIDLLGDAVAGKSTDDRACFVSILHALELLKDRPLDVDIIAVGSTKEEFDGSGARARGYADAPDYVIALDVSGAASPGAGALISIGSDSSRPLAERLMEVARAKRIPYLPRSIPAVSGTNAKHYQVAGSGAVTCVVSQPQKYMHFPVEIVRMCDVEAIGRLLAEFAVSFDGSLQGEGVI